MTAPLKLLCYHDPGHGWLAVKTAKLKELGIADRISNHSYQRGLSSYLEQDRDAALFIDAMKKESQEFVIESRHTNKSSPIRSYSQYKAA